MDRDAEIMDRDAEIEEILVDTYTQDEAMASWEVAFQDGIVAPFEATLLADPITVTGFRLSRTNAMQCHIRRESREQKQSRDQKESRERWIGVEDLDEESLPEDMEHILDLFRYWGGGD